MRMFLRVGAILLLVGASAHATVLFTEDWESGRDGWFDFGTTLIPQLSDEQNATPGGKYSLRTADAPDTHYQNALEYDFAEATPENWYVQFNFFDNGTDREYLQIRSFERGGVLGRQQQGIDFGLYHYLDTSKYCLRVNYGNEEGWIETGAERIGDQWQTLRVEQDFDGSLTFWVDGELAYESSTTAVCGVTNLRVGAALSNGNGAYFDDIEVGIVPEPTVLLGLVAGVGLLARRQRRR